EAVCLNHQRVGSTRGHVRGLYQPTLDFSPLWICPLILNYRAETNLRQLWIWIEQSSAVPAAEVLRNQHRCFVQTLVHDELQWRLPELRFARVDRPARSASPHGPIGVCSACKLLETQDRNVGFSPGERINQLLRVICSVQRALHVAACNLDHQ